MKLPKERMNKEKRKDIQLKTIEEIKDCGTCIRKNARKIAGLYDYQTGTIKITIELDGCGGAVIKVENELLNVVEVQNKTRICL